MPRWRDVRPLGVIVGTLIVFFFLQKDLGPALVLGCLSLALYGIARGRMPLVLAGFSILICGFAAGYWLGVPATLAHRVAIWLDPWNNGLSRGDQIAHALWGLASGGPWGVGLGVGDGRLIPAGDTDLIVAVLGEDLGFVGLMAVAGLYGLLIWRMLKIAARAPGAYTAFLGMGLALSLAVPTIVIVGGLLGLLPLSGVATPFLSYGKSSMICNFAAVAIVLAIARRTGPPRPVFARQVRTVSWVLFAVATALVGRTAMIQVVQADTVALRPNLGRQADGALRFQYNPRLLIAAGLIHRGTIYDRNGFALATSNSNETQPFLDRLAALELATGEECSPAPARCYPLGGRAFHLLGDSSRQTNWSAHNASFVERDSNAFLQGFDDHAQTVQLTLGDGGTQMAVLRDYRDLLPLVRNKGDANNAAVRALLDKPRDLHLTLDGPLQLLVATALEARVREAGVTHGAAVVMDVATGAILASASYPWPGLSRPDGSHGTLESDQLLDRARYGLYPPGSTFKLVTACAALNASMANVSIEFSCERLSDGRVGARVKGVGTLRDDLLDPAPHGRIDLLKALVVSCNVYFGQLAVRIGADRLADTAAAAKIQVAAQPANLRRTLPFVGYGQGEVLASPIRMARVAAAIASDGMLRDPTLLQGERHPENEQRLVSAAGAAFLRGAMRHVVTMGTGRVLAGETIPIAGKTGTAELHNAPSHSWFVGFAPYGTETRQIAFAIVVENAGYGSRVAAPLAGDIVKAAHVTGVIR